MDDGFVTKIKGISGLLGSLPKERPARGHLNRYQQGSGQPQPSALKESVAGPGGPEEVLFERTQPTHYVALGSGRKIRHLLQGLFRLGEQFVRPVCHGRQRTGHCREWGHPGKESHICLRNEINECPPPSDEKWFSVWDGHSPHCNFHFPLS